MAKRKRKMTLFDVINTGQPIGLQHRQRVPTYQPTPELPVTKKLAKLFGRRSATDRDRPLSAAEQLEQLRRELVGEDAAVKSRVAQPEPARVYAAIKDDEPEADAAIHAAIHVERPAARSRVADLAQVAEAAERREAPAREPHAPRKPIGEVFRESWARVEPKLSSAGDAIAARTRSATSRGVAGSKIWIERGRDLAGRYGVTAAAAAAVIVVLCGSFYAGRLLFTRPAPSLPGNDLIADGTPRPDVLNVGGGGNDTAKANEPIANVSNNATQAKLEKKAEPQQPAPGVFGGRRLDTNYVIIQSYYSESDADAAIEVLAKYGVKASVEQNLPRWSGRQGQTNYSIVSLDSFAKMKDDPVYQAFIKKIEGISEREKGNTLPNSLDPRPYRYTPATPK